MKRSLTATRSSERLSAAFFLSKYPISPSTEAFQASYEIIRRLAIEPGDLISATATIQDYDGTSDFGIYVNGYGRGVRVKM